MENLTNEELLELYNETNGFLNELKEKEGKK